MNDPEVMRRLDALEIEVERLRKLLHVHVHSPSGEPMLKPNGELYVRARRRWWSRSP